MTSPPPRSSNRRNKGFFLLPTSVFALLILVAIIIITTAALALFEHPQAASAFQSQPFFSQGHRRFSHRITLSTTSTTTTTTPTSFLLLSSTSTSTINEDSANINSINLEPSLAAAALKEKLLQAISHFRTVRNRADNNNVINIGWGVKGKELNATSRAPQKTDFYAISPALGQAADAIYQICTAELAAPGVSQCREPTAFLGDKELGATKSPLHGAWKLLFTTAADATFDNNKNNSNSTTTTTRGPAKVQNVVDASRGRITNVIDFCTKSDGTEPALKQLNVVIAAQATSPTRVDLQFKYAKLVLTKFLFFPLPFGRRLSLYIPVPATFITRCIVLLGRLFRRSSFKTPPVPYFEVLYLDKDLRIHKTGEDNLFVQARESWKDALPLLTL